MVGDSYKLEITTPTVSIDATFFLSERAPFGEMKFMLGDRKIFRWHDNFQYFHYPIAKVLTRLCRAEPAEVGTIASSHDTNSLKALATRHQKLSSTECLDGADYYAFCHANTVYVIWELWRGWGDNDNSNTKWFYAKCEKEDLVRAVDEYTRHVDNWVTKAAKLRDE